VLVFELTAKEKSGLSLVIDYASASLPDVFGKEKALERETTLNPEPLNL